MLVAMAVAGIALMPAGAMAYAPIKGGTYKGKTDDGQSVKLKVTKSGKAFGSGSRVNYTVTCNDGSRGDDFFSLTDLPIGGNGDFSLPDFTDTDSKGVTVTLTTKGKFKSKGKKVSGSVSSKVNGTDPQTGVPFSCESGETHFSAKLQAKKEKKS